MKQLYTIGEVAEILRFSEQTIREWARNGQIKAVRPGLRAWRIPRSEVQRLLSEYQIDESALEIDDKSGYTDEHIQKSGHGAFSLSSP